MKLSRLLILLLPLLLTACGLSDQQKADYARVHGDALSLYDIKALSHAGVSDGIILRYLRDQHTVYNLNSEDVAGLRKAGVSQSIVDYMLQTPQTNGPGIYPYPYGYYGYGPYWGGPYWGQPYPYPYYYHRWR